MFMPRVALAAGFFLFGGLLVAQTALSNDSVIKLIKAGLSDDLIVSTVNAVQGTFDTSADGLISLKAAGASDKVISVIVSKAATPTSQPLATPPVPELAIQHSISAKTSSKPRVFLQSASKGTNRNAARDQSMEMSKDLERDCPELAVTINQQMADYTIVLNHIEVGFARDNQIQVANKDGDLLSKTKEDGSIAGGMKKACALMLEDWAKK